MVHNAHGYSPLKDWPTASGGEKRLSPLLSMLKGFQYAAAQLWSLLVVMESDVSAKMTGRARKSREKVGGTLQC